MVNNPSFLHKLERDLELLVVISVLRLGPSTYSKATYSFN